MSDRLQQLLKFHQADPTDVFCAYGIALEHAKAGRTDAAIEWLDTALRHDADYVSAYYQKAKLLADAGRVAEARGAVGAGLAAAQRTGDSHAAGELAALGDSIG